MFKKIALAATLVLLASPSFAAENAAFYVGADVGTTKIDTVSDRDTSYGAFFGYKFNKNVAVEASYRYLAKVKVPLGKYVTSDMSYNQYALSVIGILPLSSGFEVFGRLGRNSLERGSIFDVIGYDKGSSTLYGVGVNYTFTPNISARLELQSPSSHSKNLSAGVSYSF